MELSLFEQAVEEIRKAYHGLRVDGWADLPVLNNIEGKAKHWVVGRKEAQEHNTIPRVVWIRVDGDIAPPVKGQQTIEDDKVISPLYAANTTVLCEIMGENDAQLERMWMAVLLAARTVLDTASGPRGFTFLTQEAGRSGHLNAAEVIEQMFSWPFTVPREVRPTVKLQTQHHDDELHGRGTDTTTTETHPDETP